MTVKPKTAATPPAMGIIGTLLSPPASCSVSLEPRLVVVSVEA